MAITDEERLAAAGFSAYGDPGVPPVDFNSEPMLWARMAKQFRELTMGGNTTDLQKEVSADGLAGWAHHGRLVAGLLGAVLLENPSAKNPYSYLSTLEKDSPEEELTTKGAKLILAASTVHDTDSIIPLRHNQKYKLAAASTGTKWLLDVLMPRLDTPSAKKAAFSDSYKKETFRLGVDQVASSLRDARKLIRRAPKLMRGIILGPSLAEEPLSDDQPKQAYGDVSFLSSYGTVHTLVWNEILKRYNLPLGPQLLEEGVRMTDIKPPTTAQLDWAEHHIREDMNAQRKQYV